MSAHGVNPAWFAPGTGIQQSRVRALISVLLECEIKVDENDISRVVTLLDLTCDIKVDENNIRVTATAISLTCFLEIVE